MDLSASRAVAPGRAEPVAVRYDPWIAAPALLLVALGLVMVYSASAVYALRQTGRAGYYLERQAMAAAVGFGAMLLALKLGYRRLWRLAPWLIALALLLLLAVLIPGLGRTAGGARRWLKLGPVPFQPGEFAKVAFVIWLARSVASRGERLKNFTSGLLPHAVMVLLIAGLLLLEPDFGTAVLLLAIAFIVLFVAGARLAWLGGALLLAVPAAAFLVARSPYRMRRLLAFIHPWAERSGAGYQVAQSLLSVGSGGLFGVGLGESRQKLFFLPAAHTDFILSIVGEELGLLGLAVVVGLFGLLAWRGLKAAFRARDAFGTALALGITALLSLEALINAGMAMGMLPTKGMALPFVSAGGTQLCCSMFCAGLLLSISGEPAHPVDNW